MSDAAYGRCLGLVGGLAVGATVYYYRELVSQWERGGGSPRLLIVHADVRRVLADVRAGRRRELAEYLAGFLEQLQAGGAELAAIPSVTTHFGIAELLPISPLPIVNLLDVIHAEVQARGLRRVAIFGTRFTMETGIFGSLQDVELVRLAPGELDYVHKAYMQMALDGVGTDQQHDGLTALAHTLIERDGAEAILLAGTDLALVFNETNTHFPHLDCAAVHVRALVRAMRSEPAGKR